MAAATMTASPQASESSYVTADMWSIFEESGLDDLASSFIRPHSSPTRPSFTNHLTSTTASPSPPTLKSASLSLLGSVDDHHAASSMGASASPLSADFLISPLRSSAFTASPGGYLRPPASLRSPFMPPSPLLGGYDHTLHHSPSLRIMKQFQSSTSASSLAALSPSPSHHRHSSFSPLRSPLLPSAYLGSFPSHSSYYRHAGKSAFEPQLYTTSPLIKQERGTSPSSSPSVLRIPTSLSGDRVDGLQSIEEDDVTASSFPSLPSLSSMSSGGSSAFSSLRSEGMELADERVKSESASSSLSAPSGLVSGESAGSTSSHKRGRPSMQPASPPSRNKRLKRSESTSSSTSSNSPTPPPTSSSSKAADTSAGQQQPRQQKGLRHFSLKVCEKVEQQGVTTYNNVADELVADLANEPATDDDDAGDGGGGARGRAKVAYDEKNVRRRVYDALNVLTAMGIIVKEKKKITWIGLPGGVSQTVGKLAEEKKARDQRLKEKRNHLQELLVYVVALKNLKQRNIAAINAASTPTSTTTPSTPTATPATPPANALSLAHDHIPLRFVLIKTDASHIVHLSVSPSQTELHCDVSGAFVLHDESEVLKGLGLAAIDGFDLPYLIPREICSFYPERYVRRTGGGGGGGGTGGVDEAVGGRIGPGTVSLGGLKRK